MKFYTIWYNTLTSKKGRTSFKYIYIYTHIYLHIYIFTHTYTACIVKDACMPVKKYGQNYTFHIQY